MGEMDKTNEEDDVMNFCPTTFKKKQDEEINRVEDIILEGFSSATKSNDK